ncbi:MAG: CapA family protein [Cellulosilyticaceae bacterium]
MRFTKKMFEVSLLLITLASSLNTYCAIPKEEKTITISAAGDVTLGYYYGQSNWNRFDTVAKKNGYDYFFKHVSPIFKHDDLTLVNLEGPLTTSGKRTQKEFVMRGEPIYTEILTLGSIEAVNLANNHTMDYGLEGYNQTKSALDKSEIAYFGEDIIMYQEINGIRVALIGAKGWDASQSTKDKLKKQIDTAHMQADLVIAMMHWGVELEHYPNNTQKNLAYYMIDQGVDLVLGSHPHVTQGLEKYKDKTIVYSMGNFSFGGNRNPANKETFIYQETFRLTDTEITSVESKVIPCRISSKKDINNYQPIPLQETEGNTVLNNLKTYSKGFPISYFSK